MADRTTAALFGYLFETLAKGSLDAATLWYRAQLYDFTDEQMGCRDDCLKQLGLLHTCTSCGWRWVYGPIESSPSCEECGADLNKEEACPLTETTS